jgi:hypothetical protein
MSFRFYLHSILFAILLHHYTTVEAFLNVCLHPSRNVQTLYKISSLSRLSSGLWTRDSSHQHARSEKKLSEREQSTEIRKLLEIPEHEWVYATIQSVAPFGLFVRPVGFSVTGKRAFV